MKDIKFEDLRGLVIAEIKGLEAGSDEVTFVTKDGRKFYMYHRQECCEDVSIEDVAGDVESLIGSPITLAVESMNDEHNHNAGKVSGGSETWTFYRIGTIKGTVVIRWYGTSNGYYSESVTFCEVPNPGNASDVRGPW